MPRRALTALSASSLPSGRLPVSCSRRPIRVDLPWSTWPTMTMRTSGRLATLAAKDADGSVTRTFMELCLELYLYLEPCLEIAGDAQPLERIFRFVVHGAAGALGHLGAVELGDDLLERARVRHHREGDVGVAQRSIAASVARQIERDDRNAVAPRIGPDVGLRPMQDRMNAQMRALRRRGVEVVPELRRLVAHVPAPLDAARREDPLLGAGRLLVAADAGEQAVETVLGERELQSFGLARGRARRRRQGRVDGLDRRAGLDQEIELPFDRVAIAKRIHLGKLLAGIDMQSREWYAAEEGLAGEPDHHVGIFAERPQQGEVPQAREGLAENEDALRFELAEAVHGRPRSSQRRRPGASEKNHLVFG